MTSGLIASRCYWDSLVEACRTKINRHPNGVSVMTQVRDMPLLTTYDGAEEAMLQSRCNMTWGRFAVFIMWLHRHLKAYEWWNRLVQHHFHYITEGVSQVATA